MSVTFAAQWVDGEHTIRCACGDTRVENVWPSYAEASAAQRTVLVPCPDEYCRADAPHGFVVESQPAPEVNVSNGNAVMILDTLGIDTDLPFEDRCVGSLPAENFLGRVLLALAVTPEDAGMPAYADGRVIHCGRPAGYLGARLQDLHKMATYASQRGLKVTWG